ncbi:antigen WC1.1-like [Pomacea canaliculata]|uniref:antigen WC1.1-like n=1 Tax=Pomacea canaliculata TaxID=400727 RepID=UPI000D72FBF3|nr:antigen WC1.1-like [Pomacea canaliculata]
MSFLGQVDQPAEVSDTGEVWSRPHTVITNLRLAGSTTNSSGRVEVFLQGPDQWGTVCDYGWDDFDAIVVCHQLGYATGKAVKNAAFGEGQGRIWLDMVSCLGMERRLQDCAFMGFGDNYCFHYNDAGVICSGVYVLPTSVTNTVTSIVTYTTVGRESPETSSVHDSTQSQLTQTHSGSYTAAIVVPVLIVVIVIAIAVAVIIYRRRGGMNVEQLVNEEETRPGLLSFGAGGFISHVRDKLKRKNGRGDVHRGTDVSENVVYYDPGLSNPVYDITVLPDKSAEDDV